MNSQENELQHFEKTYESWHFEKTQEKQLFKQLFTRLIQTLDQTIDQIPVSDVQHAIVEIHQFEAQYEYLLQNASIDYEEYIEVNFKRSLYRAVNMLQSICLLDKLDSQKRFTDTVVDETLEAVREAREIIALILHVLNYKTFRSYWSEYQEEKSVLKSKL